jgi:sigma-B regulation protein RsbU (phosphoserine phosphatase)
LFTDGVSEAMSAGGIEYGEERLESILAGAGGKAAQAIMLEIQQDVRRYAAGAAQSDDITMMVVRATASRHDS